MRHCSNAVPVNKNDAKITKTRLSYSNTNNNCASSNWRHDWWQINHKTYAKVLKGDNRLEYGNQEAKVKDQAFAFKTKQNANKCLAPKSNIDSKTRQNVAQPQGVKSDIVECDKHHRINNSHSNKWFNIDTIQCVKFKPKHRNAVNLAKHNATFKRWDDETTTKYGFILLGDFLCLDKDNRNPDTADLLDIHDHVKSTGNFNFMDAQISVPSQLRVDRWDSYLKDYWDDQLKFLIRYGFPIDFNNKILLSSEENNHSSATEFPDLVTKYFHDEGRFGAILSPFSTHPSRTSTYPLV